MLAALGVARALMGSALGKLWSWLTSLSFWQLAFMAACAVAILFYFQRNDARHDAASYLKQRDYYKGELQRITTARDKQSVTTKRTVEEASRGRAEAEPKARRVETAPLPGNCATPPQILSADI